MKEEFHGIYHEDGTYTWRLLYGWGTINASVWLPSLCELVGTTGAQNTFTGTYYSAMQGLSLSSNQWTDAQGGEQFAYFKQYNTSGGGEKVWAACKREVSWLRSPRYVDAVISWVIDGERSFNAYYSYTSLSYAVHPAV